MYRFCIILLVAAFSTAALEGAHFRTITRNESGLIKQSDAYAENGNLLIEERRFNISASVSEAAGNHEVTTQAEPGEISDTIIFHAKEQEILARKRNSKTCEWINADSKMPAGLMPGQGAIEQQQKQFAGGMAQLNKALAEAKSGLSEEDRKMLEQYTAGLTGGEVPGIQPRDALQLIPTGENKTVNDLPAKGFRAETADGDVYYVLWLTQMDKVEGGREMKDALFGMLEFYEKFLEGMASLMDTSVLDLLRSPDLSGMYLVRLEDVRKNEWSDVVYHDAGPVDVDFYPDCERVDMLGGLSGP